MVGKALRLFLVCSLAWWQQAAVALPSLVLRNDSFIELKGDSTLHAFASKTSALTVNGTIASNDKNFTAVWQKIQKKNALTSFELSFPVTSLKSDSTSLDENLHAHLKAKEFPVIRFKLSSYHLEPASTSETTLTISGLVSVAGKEKPISIPASVRVDDQVIWIKGELPLTMSSFGIEPPTMMLGAIKTKDEVTISFNCAFTLAY